MILQARILEWFTISFSGGSSQPRDRTWFSHIGGRRFNLWATREAPKKGNAKECSNYHTVALISHAGKVMLKILQDRLQQYVKQELTSWVSKRLCGNTGLIANICWITEKAREFQKNIYFCFFDYAKAFDCVDHNKMWKILKRLRGTRPPVYESTSSRTRYGTTDWFTIGKGIQQSCILSIAYLTSMQSTSCEMPGWMNYKMNQDCLEKYQ